MSGRNEVRSSFASYASSTQLQYAQAAGDYNGDGKDDILWRNINGGTTTWLGDSGGGFIANGSASIPDLPDDWQIIATGKFNSDNRSDLVLRNADGNVALWFGAADGGFTGTLASKGFAPAADWTIYGVGDFNGDGQDDLLWRHSTGTVTTWSGTSDGRLNNNVTLAARVPTDWTIVGTGDFNGDGVSDILWRNATGEITDWFGKSDGTFTANANLYAIVPTDWKVVGTGDFNGDGIDDILWRHDTGPLTTWIGNAAGDFVPSTIWAEVPNDWKVASTGDFNGDGRDDVLWRNDNGGVTTWDGLPSGDFLPNNDFLAQVDNNWQVQPTGAYWSY